LFGKKLSFTKGKDRAGSEDTLSGEDCELIIISCICKIAYHQQLPLVVLDVEIQWGRDSNRDQDIIGIERVENGDGAENVPSMRILQFFFIWHF